MFDQLIKLFLLIIAGCGAFFATVLTLFLANAVFYIVKEEVKNLICYASGKCKDHGEKKVTIN